MNIFDKNLINAIFERLDPISQLSQQNATVNRNHSKLLGKIGRYLIIMAAVQALEIIAIGTLIYYNVTTHNMNTNQPQVERSVIEETDRG